MNKIVDKQGCACYNKSIKSYTFHTIRRNFMFEKDKKYIFGVCKIGEKGQIVIPKDARKLYDLKAGDSLLMLGDEKGMALIKTEIFSNIASEILKED